MAITYASSAAFLTMYMAALLLNALLSLGILHTFIAKNRHQRSAYWLGAFMLAVAWWSATLFAELMADNLAAKLFWKQLQAPAAVLLPVLVLLFVLAYANESRWLQRKYLIGYLLPPACFTLLAWTNAWHGLVWSGMPVQTIDRFTLLTFDKGAGYWVMMVYAYGCLLAAVIWLFRYFRTQQGLYRRQAGLLLLCLTIPWVGEIAYNSGVMLPAGLDFTIFGLAITTWLMVLVLSRFSLLSLTPIALNRVFAEMRQAVVVVDGQNLLAHFNPAARALFNLKSRDIGQPMTATAIPNLPLPTEGSNYDELEWPGAPERIIGVTVSAMTDRKERVVGGLYVFLDVTSTYRMQQALWRRQMELAILEAQQSAQSELHLKTGQMLRHISSLSQDAIRLLEAKQTATALTNLAELAEIARNAKLDLDYVAGQTLPSEESPPDFFAALQRYFRLIAQIYALPITFIYPSAPANDLVSPEAQVQLAHILQRLLDIVIEQGEANNVHIVTARHNDWLETTLTHSQRQDIPHTLQRRAAAVGGSIEERVNLEQGSQIVIQMPCVQPARPQAYAGLRVLLVDNNKLMLAGFKGVLEARGLLVVGVATSGQEAIQRTQELQPDLVLMDAQLAGMSGIEAARQIKTLSPAVKVVIVTSSQNRDDLLAALRSGVSGYLLKTLDPEQFFVLLTGVLDGATTLAPSMVDQLILEAATSGLADDKSEVSLTLAGLTSQQLEVLRLVGQGATYDQVAATLHMAESTVRYHMKQIKAKLDAANRAEVMIRASQLGLLADTPDPRLKPDRATALY